MSYIKFGDHVIATGLTAEILLGVCLGAVLVAIICFIRWIF